MPYSETMKEIQQVLVDHHGQQIDVDGWIGPATERAILVALQPPPGAAETPPGAFSGVIADVPHISQGAPEVAQIRLGFDDTADTCQKSGCLSCCLWSVLCAQGMDVSCDSFIEHLAASECYTDSSLLITQKACDEVDAVYCREITAHAAHNYLSDGIPIILRIHQHGHSHFVVAIGYDADKGYAVHDVGTRRGNFYDNPRYIAAAEVTRYDAAVRNKGGA